MLTIREATEADVPLLARLADEAFPATYRGVLTPGQIDYMIQWMYAPEVLLRELRGGIKWFVACSQGEACGYLSIERQNKELFHLRKIYLLPRWQGVGAGALLFAHAVEHIRQAHPGRSRMELNVNRRNRALGFYLRMGMRMVREGDFSIGGGYWMNDYILGMEIE